MPEGAGPVVVDTTPIITLSVARQLDLLRALYGRVLIPRAVREEILAGGEGRAGAGEVAAASWIETADLREARRATLLSDLDRGESEVLALAMERKARLVVLDERLARRHATRLDLPLTGSLGILLRAKQKGLIPAVTPLVESVRLGGIHLAEDLIQRVLQLAGEG